jgi:outer membrane protein OmpA-like peptidoglycan-associated protein
MSNEVLSMKRFLIVSTVAAILVAGGCATKSYVRKSIEPVNGKLDEQAHTLSQTAQSLQKTQLSLAADEAALNATRDRAALADAHAGDALIRAGDAITKATDAANKADQASQRANQVGQDMADFRTQLDVRFAHWDDYKKVSTATVNFKLNSDKLDSDAKHQVDEMAASGGKYKRYFIGVEGFTDQTGSEAYNVALSRRRADAVVAYLVSGHDIPVYRIQMIGLGKDKPVDEGKSPSSRAKNRRVEVTVYSADPNPATMKGATSLRFPPVASTNLRMQRDRLACSSFWVIS